MRELTDTAAGVIQGIGLIVVGYLIIVTGDVAAKWSLPAVGVAGAMIWRGVFGATTVAVLARSPWRLRPVRWGLVLLRSFLHTLVSLAWYVAWLSMSLVDTAAIGFITPLLMTLLAIPLLGERIRWRRALSTLVGFGGVLIMLQPGGDMWTPAVVPLLGGIVLLAISRIMTRMLARTETPECITFFLLAAHVPMGLLLLAWFPSTLDLAGLVWVGLIGMGVCNGIAHWLFARAYAVAPVGALAPYEYTTLLWAGILGYLVFAEVPAWTTVAGAVVVVAAGMYNFHRERVRRREERAGRSG